MPLTAAGRVQAAALGRRLAEVLAGAPPAVVLTSPRSRAVDTSALAGLGAATVTDDLAEWDYGTYEGRTTAEIVAERPGWSLFADGAPGGETADQVGARVDRVLAGLRQVDGTVVCVAHAHLLRVFAARWVGAPARWGQALVLAPASISQLGWEHGQPVICTWNAV